MSVEKVDKTQKIHDHFVMAIADDWSFTFHVSPWLLLIIILLAIFVALVWRFFNRSWRVEDFEIDEAEFGLGDHKFKFKPNETDRQIAYAIWVELSTRKIGIPINLDDDVITEVYDSWYNFFGVTRELIKSVPVSKVRKDSTGKIIKLSIEVLNEGLRPHLTKWQARFRRWYNHQIEKDFDKTPQDLQKEFALYDELSKDLLAVNEHLIVYRTKMYDLVKGN